MNVVQLICEVALNKYPLGLEVTLGRCGPQFVNSFLDALRMIPTKSGRKPAFHGQLDIGIQLAVFEITQTLVYPLAFFIGPPCNCAEDDQPVNTFRIQEGESLNAQPTQGKPAQVRLGQGS